MTAGSGKYVYAPGWHERLPGLKKPRGGYYCLSAATGRLHWKYEASGVRGVAVIVSESSLYGLADDGFLYRFTR